MPNETNREAVVKITVEFLGLPTLSGLVGKKTDVEISGETVMDLVMHLARRFGPNVRKALLDSEGVMDLTIQTMINDTGFLPREALSQKRLHDGDTVKFLLLAGGG